MKTKCTPGITRTITVVVQGYCLASFADNTNMVPQAEYSTEIVGHRQGTIGILSGTMSIDRDGTLICPIQPRGFIANALSQSVPGKISETWNIIGAIYTLKTTGKKHERLGDRIAARTIKSFRADALVLKSDRGETSSFQRGRLF